MATASQVQQGLLAQIQAVLPTVAQSQRYLIPETGTVLTHVNATDLQNGTAKVGGAWTKNGSGLVYNALDAPVPSISGFSATSFLSQLSSPMCPGAAPFTAVVVVKKLSGGWGAGYSEAWSTNGSAANLGGMRQRLPSGADPNSYFDMWTGATESTDQTPDISTTGLNVFLAGFDGTNLWQQINGGDPVQVASSGYSPGTVLTAYLGNNPSDNLPLTGRLFEMLMCTATPTAPALAALYAGIQANFATVSIGVGWPPEFALHRIPKTSNPIGALFDRGSPRNRSRWPQTTQAVPDVNVTAGTTATLGLSVLRAGHTTTLTIAGTPIANDAVGLTAQSQPSLGGVTSTIYQGASYVATASDTTSTIATALAAAINANIPSVTASAAANVITLTGVANCALVAAVANQGTRLTEYHRTERLLSFHLWTPSETAREQIGDPIDQLLGQLEAQYGFTLANGEWVRIMYDGDLYMEQDQLKDIYRRDFFVRAEYGVSVSSPVYPVVATQLQLAEGQG